MNVMLGRINALLLAGVPMMTAFSGDQRAAVASNEQLLIYGLHCAAANWRGDVDDTENVEEQEDPRARCCSPIVAAPGSPPLSSMITCGDFGDPTTS